MNESRSGWKVFALAAIDEKGCRVVTDESQHGRLAFVQKIFLPSKHRKLHRVWLGELKRKAEAALVQPDTR